MNFFKKIKRHYLLVSLFTLPGAVVILSFTSPPDRLKAIAENLELYAAVYKEITTHYVDDINPNTLMKAGIDSMLVTLDPFTQYATENQIESYLTHHTGQYGGMGADSQKFSSRIFIVSVQENSPAWKVGLRVGDEVTKMNGKNLNTFSWDEIEWMAHGQVGSAVTISVIPAGAQQEITHSLKREKIKVKNVPVYQMINEEVGYIKLNEFLPDAAAEVKTAFLWCKDNNAKKIVLDLRNNPGGLVWEAVQICNLFIPKGKLVANTKGKQPANNVVFATQHTSLDEVMPVAILINAHAASASEIVSGALQDYDRAVIIGEKSYGKGLVQAPRPLPYQSQIKMTTAKYYIPSGRCIQAIDYALRRQTGNKNKIADSLKKTFRTADGRDVKDSGGIDPDVVVPDDYDSPFLDSLQNRGAFFLYARLYKAAHATIAPAVEFTLSNDETEQAIQWMKAQAYPALNPNESILHTLETAARNQSQDYAKKISDLKKILQQETEKEWSKNRTAIKHKVEQTICRFYYQEKGETENFLKQDNVVQQAVRVLSSNEYEKILKK